jgi:Trypsin-like peptidase domain
MRSRVLIGTILVLAIVFASLAYSQSSTELQNPDDSLIRYAVHVVQLPRQSWTGLGVYVGNGVILTAAHVVSRWFWVKTGVEIGGKVLPADVIKAGSFDGTDLALLVIDDQQLSVSLRLRRLSLCNGSSIPGELVITATPEGIARSHIVAPRLLPKTVDQKYRNAIADVATTANSGGGVFAADQKCLLGIVSGKISSSRYVGNQRTLSQRDIAKFFISADLIADFIPADYQRFFRRSASARRF